MKKKVAKPVEYDEITVCDGCGHDSVLEREDGEKGLCKFCIEAIFVAFFKKPRKIKPIYPTCSSYQCENILTRKDVDESEYQLQCGKCRKEREEARKNPAKEGNFSVYHLPGNP